MIRRNRILRSLATTAIGGAILSGLAMASAAPAASSEFGAGLAIAPLRVEIDGADRGATVMLTNTSERALAVQTRVFAWSQDQGEDVYAPSGDLTISPSITSIPPGETQIVRVLRAGQASPGEKSFRLVVDQLPDPSATRTGTAEARIRFTVPMFLDRSKAKAAEFQWRLGPNGLELANVGGSTARIASLQLKTASGIPVDADRNSLRYVLGNSTIVWPVENACSIGPVTVTAEIDGRTVDAQPRPACG